MIESARIGMETEEKSIISVPLRNNGCVCEAGFLLTEYYNTYEKVYYLTKSAIYYLKNSIEKTIYIENGTGALYSETLEDYIKICNEEKVDFGYLFTTEGKWVIVAGILIGELTKK